MPIFVVNGSAGSNIELGKATALPNTMMTAMVSPTARPIPKIMLARIPDLAAGILASIILGIGRAVGETMHSGGMVLGNAVALPVEYLRPSRPLLRILVLKWGMPPVNISKPCLQLVCCLLVIVHAFKFYSAVRDQKEINGDELEPGNNTENSQNRDLVASWCSSFIFDNYLHTIERESRT